MLGSADTNAILSHVQDSKISNGFVYQSKNIKLLLAISVRRLCCCIAQTSLLQRADRAAANVNCWNLEGPTDTVMVYHTITIHCADSAAANVYCGNLELWYTILLPSIRYIYFLMGNVKILQKAGLQLWQLILVYQ